MNLGVFYMKKSVRSLALALMMTSCIALFAGCGNNGTPSPSASPSAVSYTHLDVYKRQVYHTFYKNEMIELGPIT